VKVAKDLVAASATPMVLGILAEGESYGYAILRRINELSGGELDWTEGCYTRCCTGLSASVIRSRAGSR
jgi:hypothetical protein